MATITNIQGIEIYFNPAGVSAIADHDPAGNAVTTIYGILKVPVMTAESIAGFLARLVIAAEFAELTRLDGSKVLLHAPKVSTLRPVAPEDYPPAAKSEAVVGDLTQALVEDPATAAGILRAHGGKI